MLQKTNLIFAVGIIALFVGVVYTMVNITNTMITEQTGLLDARAGDQIGGVEYQRRGRESEKMYRGRIADALERIESKFLEVAKIVGRLDTLRGDRLNQEGANVRLVDQKVNITELGPDKYVVYLNGTPYDINDVMLNVTENRTLVMRVVVIEQDNYYQYYPYIPGNMSEILNLSGDYNYTADLEMIAANLSMGLENFRTDSIT
ncbi:hypothetical protein BMS3Abin16_00371 [archaeon BMS3Abin16]|nr:hypothetical protein BMS3Abin16_00371 [archaeon BMS3Abin16]